MVKIIIAIVAFVIVTVNSLFIVDQRQQALIIQFGEIIDVRQDPGLNFKVPFIQDVEYYDKRLLDINIEPQEIIASDGKRIIVDAFAKYKITDPKKYYQSVRTDQRLVMRFSPVLESSIRQEVNRVELVDLITTDRAKVMEAVLKGANDKASNYGIEVVDVKILRTDLPQKNSDSVYERMITQHEKEARQTRAEGSEESTKIKSSADREKRTLIANAKKESEIIMGDGDGKATKIYASAYNRDADFYKFYRTMQAYKESLSSSDTRMILSEDSEFMRFFGDISGNGKRR